MKKKNIPSEPVDNRNKATEFICMSESPALICRVWRVVCYCCLIECVECVMNDIFRLCVSRSIEARGGCGSRKKGRCRRSFLLCGAFIGPIRCPWNKKKHRVPPGGLDVDRQQQHPTIGSKQDSQTPSPTGRTWPEIKKAQQRDRHQHEGEEGYMAVCCSKTQR